MTLKTLAEAAEEAKTRRIICAVDFGTTFSGLAWAQTARPEVQSAIVQWEDVDGSLEGQTSDKVPTEVVYDENGEVKWGFKIADDEPRYQWFKLGLDPTQDEDVSHLSLEFPDPKALPPGYDHDPAKLVTDYMTCLRKHAYNILKLKLGQGVLNTTPLEFIVTIPAIWSDAAKDRTAACATAAGMGEFVRTISEPEAAVVYTLDTMDPHNLKKGDKFVLCDAGGGTVDLISYRIDELSPQVKVSEAVKGDGGLCGSTFLNRIFGQWLDDTFGEDEDYDEEVKEMAMKAFEETAKRRFTGTEKQVIIPLQLPDDPTRGIRRGRLTIPASTIKSLFQAVIASITLLVKKQIKQTGDAKAVLLVGGFGQSPYLRNCIKNIVGPNIEVMQPAHGWTAVVRGALIRGLNEKSPDTSRIRIASRVARKWYGIKANFDYKSEVHEADRKKWSSFYGCWEVEQMSWLVNKGDDVDEGQPLSENYFRHKSVASGPFTTFTTKIYAYNSDTMSEPPLYPCSDISRLVTLTADLSNISTSLIPIHQGKDRKDYYFLDFYIKTVFFSAHTEYSLWYLGQEYGKVKAEYA